MNTITPKTDLYEYLPEWYKPVLDYQEILNAEIPQFVIAKNQLAKVHANFFIDSLDNDGLKEWEKIFILNSEGTLAERRERVKQCLWMHPPFTERYLRQRLDDIIGEDEYSLTFNRGAYKMTLSAVRVGQTFTEEPIRFINRIKPAHIVLEVVYLYNTWNDLHQYTWTQLHSYTWTQAREDGSL